MSRNGNVNENMSPKPLNALIYKDPSARTDTKRRPYLKPRSSRLPSAESIRYEGSALVAGWVPILIFSLYGIGACIFIDFVVEDALPEALESSGAFAAAWTIGQAFFLSALAFGAANKYAEAIRAMFDTLDAIQTASFYVANTVCKDKLRALVRTTRYRDYRDNARDKCGRAQLVDDPYTSEVQAIELVEEIQDLWRAMPFIIKHNFRSNPQNRFDTSIPADVDLSERGVIVALLPMRDHLRYELERVETDAISGALAMIVNRQTILFKRGLLEAAVIAGIHDQINNVGTQSSRISALQVLGLVPPYRDLLLLSLVLTGLVLPWQMWTTFGYFTIAFHIISVLFLFGIWGLGVQLGNPFNRAGTSPFIYHDVGQFMRDSARNVDDLFDKTVAEARALSVKPNDDESERTILLSRDEASQSENLRYTVPSSTSNTFVVSARTRLNNNGYTVK